MTTKTVAVKQAGLPGAATVNASVTRRLREAPRQVAALRRAFDAWASVHDCNGVCAGAEPLVPDLLLVLLVLPCGRAPAFAPRLVSRSTRSASKDFSGRAPGDLDVGGSANNLRSRV